MAKRSVKFKSEVSRLMEILAHSLYKERDIFLRELVSNSVDALNRVRVLAMGDEPVVDRDAELKVEILADRESRTLTVRDTGIGMNEQELARNLGTIAHSGSRAFLEKLKDDQVSRELIGQFGVGFYSVFMVADQVTVTSRSCRPEDAPAVWRSAGQDRFETETLDTDRPRGTEVVLHLREDADEFLEPSRIRAILNRYSRFAPFPISVNGEQLEQGTPLWLEQPSQVSDEQYRAFYSYLAHGDREPLGHLHVSSDAPVDLKAILYIPGLSLLKFGLEDQGGLRLYCRKVLIEERTEDLLPGWLRFLRGVVDSEDVELNVSRETIQNNPVYRKIRKVLAGRVVKYLKDMLANDRETYEKFFDEFGPYLKDGIVREADKKEDLADLLLFQVADRDQRWTLRQYLDASESADAVYYLSGGDRKSLEASPHLEKYRKDGVPVLLLTTPVDEFVVNHLHEYNGRPFKLVSRDETVADASQAGDDPNDPVLARLNQLLKDRVAAVRYSNRLVDSPFCLVSMKHGMSSSMEQMMRAFNETYEPTRRILELNPDHPMIRALGERIRSGRDGDRVELAAHAMVDQAMLMDGQMPDIPQMTGRGARLLEMVLAADGSADGDGGHNPGT